MLAKQTTVLLSVAAPDLPERQSSAVTLQEVASKTRLGSP
jgi:hypothetical protein